MNKPPLASKTNLPGVASRYEDFLGTGIAQAGYMQFVVITETRKAALPVSLSDRDLLPDTGHFYPYHRLLLAVYEQQARDCGYNGARPY